MQCNERDRGIIKLSCAVWKKNKKELTIRNNNNNDKPFYLLCCYDGVIALAADTITIILVNITSHKIKYDILSSCFLLRHISTMKKKKFL